MKFLPTFLLTVFASGIVLAAPPENHRPDRYKDLYLNSAITDPPLVVEPDPIPNDLPDWVLVGVSKYIGKVEVEVMNIKDRTRVRIPSKDATEMGFAIKEVQQGANYVDDTVVILKKGRDEGPVRFDTKFLVLKKVAGPSGASNKKAATNSRTTKGQTSRQPTPPRPGSKSSNVPRPGKTTTSTPKRVRYLPSTPK